MKLKIKQIAGLGGVSHYENERAIRAGRYLEWPMLLTALWLLIEWYLQELHILTEDFAALTDIVLWSFFVFETLLLTILVDNKWHYLASNWLNCLIIFIGIPSLWSDHFYVGALRSLRLIIMVGLLASLSRTIYRSLVARRMLITVIVVFFFVITAGILMATIDPSVGSAWDGVWWAWVTITTVGYGDVVPSSTPGRILAMVLIFIGIGLFSLITANFAALFVARQQGKIESKESHILHEIKLLSQQIEVLTAQLKQSVPSKHDDTKKHSR